MLLQSHPPPSSPSYISLSVSLSLTHLHPSLPAGRAQWCGSSGSSCSDTFCRAQDEKTGGEQEVEEDEEEGGEGGYNCCWKETGKQRGRRGACFSHVRCTFAEERHIDSAVSRRSLSSFSLFPSISPFLCCSPPCLFLPAALFSIWQAGLSWEQELCHGKAPAQSWLARKHVVHPVPPPSLGVPSL